MSSAYSREEISAQLLAYIRESFLSGDAEGELDERTPLLEYGILNSLNTATLIAYIRDEFGIVVPLADVTAETFNTVDSLGTMLFEMRAANA